MGHLSMRILASALGALGTSVVVAEPVVDVPAADCRLLTEAQTRLACYDGIFGAPQVPAAEPEKATPVVDTAVNSVSTATSVEEAAPQPGVDLSLAEAMDAIWELTPETRRRQFVIRTYMPNYLLPLHYISSVNQTPYSPTRGAASDDKHYLNTEAKMQISLRAKMATSLLFSGDSVWFAYTQKSSWQVWDHADSAPFRTTDYQPEAIYVTPVPESLGNLPGGWRWRMAQVGFAHQSNGQSDPLSRSWNRLYAGLGVERGEFGLFVQPMFRIPESRHDDDNPDLLDYIGKLELRGVWFPGKATATVTARINPDNLGRGSWQLDWSYPFDETEPMGPRWYLQLFTGYGETLLDYNHRQTSLGVGVMLFQF